METIHNIESELRTFQNPEKERILPRFFKTGPGEYGEGDRFIGVVVPNIRIVARNHKSESLDIISRLLDSEWHEMRMCGLMILVEQCRKSTPKSVLDFYLSRTGRINNWDLVDLSAPTVVGGYVAEHPDEAVLLDRLAESELLWDQRVSIVSTQTLIRKGILEPTFSLAEKMLNHPHDLMHKAIGWMLREAGKKDQARLESFLDIHASRMPRTMLRYSIEKFPEPLRQHYLHLK